MAESVADAVPEARSTTSWGTPAADLGAGVTAQLVSSRRRRARRRCRPLHARGRSVLLLPPERRRQRTVRRLRCAARVRMSRRDELAANLRSGRGAHRRRLRCRRPLPRRDHPRRRDQDLSRRPTSTCWSSWASRTSVRIAIPRPSEKWPRCRHRRPPPLRRRPPDQQGGRRRALRRRRAERRPPQAGRGRCRAEPSSPSGSSAVSCRSTSGPGLDIGQVRRRAGRRRRLADLVAGSPGLRLDGVMTVAPLGRRPADEFRRARRHQRKRPPAGIRRRRRLGRHERRL